MTRDEHQGALVREYAAAKSRQDVEGALARCHPLLLRERFFFDLPALCEGVGLRLDALQKVLAPLRAPIS